MSNATGRLIFQSSLPRGERLHVTGNKRITGDFNPRSHEGSDCVAFGRDGEFAISILAPTRGATYRLVERFFRGIFQSSLPRGERLRLILVLFVVLGISILAPTRGATQLRLDLNIGNKISILAPTRGATLKDKRSFSFFNDFNPRSHEGSDQMHPFFVT